jgi:hypothetical protein
MRVSYDVDVFDTLFDHVPLPPSTSTANSISVDNATFSVVDALPLSEATVPLMSSPTFPLHDAIDGAAVHTLGTANARNDTTPTYQQYQEECLNNHAKRAITTPHSLSPPQKLQRLAIPTAVTIPEHSPHAVDFPECNTPSTSTICVTQIATDDERPPSTSPVVDAQSAVTSSQFALIEVATPAAQRKRTTRTPSSSSPLAKAKRILFSLPNPITPLFRRIIQQLA